MQFFLRSLEGLAKKLDDKYGRYLNIGGYLNHRQKELLDLIKEKKTVKKEDVVSRFPDVSERTLQRDLATLESELLIEKVGRGEGDGLYYFDAEVKRMLQA